MKSVPSLFPKYSYYRLNKYYTYIFYRSTVTTVMNNGIVALNKNKECDMNNLAGPSGVNKRTDCEGMATLNFLKPNRISKKYDETTNEMLLSNCSLNSSSSGSSSNSFENKPTHNDNEASEQWENKPWLNSSGSSLNVTLTPSESTSELSVLNVNNINNPTSLLNKKSATLLIQRGLKPTISTGAIPKSISFDMSADKGLEDENKKRNSFLGKIRMGFKNKRGKSSRGDDTRNDADDFSLNKRNPPCSPVKSSNIGKYIFFILFVRRINYL